MRASNKEKNKKKPKPEEMMYSVLLSLSINLRNSPLARDDARVQRYGV